MRAVNLLPPERRGGQRSPAVGAVVRQPLLPASIVVAVLVAVGLGFMAHSASSTVSDRRATVEQLDSQLSKLTASQQAQPTGGTASRVAAASMVVGQRTSWDGFLNTLSRVVPEDVWLLSLSAQGGVAATSPAPATPGSAAPTG